MHGWKSVGVILKERWRRYVSTPFSRRPILLTVFSPYYRYFVQLCLQFDATFSNILFIQEYLAFYYVFVQQLKQKSVLRMSGVIWSLYIKRSCIVLWPYRKLFESPTYLHQILQQFCIGPNLMYTDYQCIHRESAGHWKRIEANFVSANFYHVHVHDYSLVPLPTKISGGTLHNISVHWMLLKISTGSQYIFPL